MMTNTKYQNYSEYKIQKQNTTKSRILKIQNKIIQNTNNAKSKNTLNSKYKAKLKIY